MNVVVLSPIDSCCILAHAQLQLHVYIPYILYYLQLLHLAHVQPELRLYSCQHLLRLKGLADVVLATCL